VGSGAIFGGSRGFPAETRNPKGPEPRSSMCVFRGSSELISSLASVRFLFPLSLILVEFPFGFVVDRMGWFDVV
jgi:hypothetical protein